MSQSIYEVDHLVRELDNANPNKDEYHKILSRCHLDEQALAKYTFFNKTHYTRNLIKRTDNYEMMLLCWESEQITPVHDHNASDGWLLGIKGELEEQQYLVEKLGTAQDSGFKLHLTETSRARAHELSYINDDIGVHLIRNCLKEKSISLHFYAPPIDRCFGYNEQTQEIKERQMSYYSMHGQLCEKASN